LEADLSRRKRKKVIDKLAAVLILQGYLDQSRRTNDGTLFQE
jgi:putative Holliday junction resolvase